MENKTVIVTGGSSGMGLYMAKRFAKEGANVAITGRNEERLQQAKEKIMQSATGSVLPIPMDVREIDDVERMVQETVQAFGTIDHLVNNAAGNFVVRAEDLSVNGWNAVVDIV